MHSSASGAAARMALRSAWSAARLSSLTAARYSSMVGGLAAAGRALGEEAGRAAAERRRRQQYVQLGVARADALLHRGLEHRVADLLRLIPDRVRERGLAALFDEDERADGLAAGPILV